MSKTPECSFALLLLHGRTIWEYLVAPSIENTLQTYLSRLPEYPDIRWSDPEISDLGEWVRLKLPLTVFKLYIGVSVMVGGISMS